MRSHSKFSITNYPIFLLLIHSKTRLVGSNSTRLGNSSFTETVLEATSNILQMAHTASTSGLSSLGLGAPVVGTHAGSRVTALSAGLLLLVISAVSAALAEGVGLSVTLTGSSGTFGLFARKKEEKLVFRTGYCVKRMAGSGRTGWNLPFGKCERGQVPRSEIIYRKLVR